MNNFVSRCTASTRFLPGVVYFLIGLNIVIFVVSYAQPLKDGDIWWHMLYGEYFLHHKTLIADHTLFSWTPSSNNTIYCTWLPDIIFYLLYAQFGLPALFIFRYMCMLLPLFGLWKFSRKQKLVFNPLTWFIMLLFQFMSIAAAFCKPEIISYVLMSALVWNWWYIKSQGDKAVKNCYLFPFLILVWVNSHGGVIFGIAFIVAVILGEILNISFSRFALPHSMRRHFFFSMCLCFVALFFTPYGSDYLVQLIQSILPTQENLSYNDLISAYDSPFAGQAANLHFANYANFALVILLFLSWCTVKTRLDFTFLLTNLLFAFFFTRFLRTTFYWAPVFAFSSLYLLSSVEYLSRKVVNRIISLTVVFISIFLSARVIYQVKCNLDTLWLGFGISEFHPVESAEFIAEHLPGQRIGNTYGAGAYLLWRLRPEQGVLVDSRHFPFKSWSAELFSAQNGVDVEKFVNRYHADVWCVAIEHIEMATWFYSSSDWDLVFYGKNAAVFVRNGLMKENENVSSPIIDQFRSNGAALRLIVFTLMIRDLHTTEKIVAKLESISLCPITRKLAYSSSLLLNAVQAYDSGNYLSAVRSLQKIEDDSPVDSKKLLAYSLLHIASNAWLKDDVDAAWRIALEALKS